MTKAVPYFPLYAANFLSARPFRVESRTKRAMDNNHDGMLGKWKRSSKPL